MIMKSIDLQKIARNSALILGLALMSVLSTDAQNSNTGNSINRTANSNTTGAASQTTNSNTTTVGNTAATNNTTSANTTRTETPATPRATVTSTPRTEVQTVVEKENNFPWGLLGLLGLAGLIPKKRSVEVSGVRETTRETRTASDNRDNKS